VFNGFTGKEGAPEVGVHDDAGGIDSRGKIGGHFPGDVFFHPFLDGVIVQCTFRNVPAVIKDGCSEILNYPANTRREDGSGNMMKPGICFGNLKDMIDAGKVFKLCLLRFGNRGFLLRICHQDSCFFIRVRVQLSLTDVISFHRDEFQLFF